MNGHVLSLAPALLPAVVSYTVHLVFNIDAEDLDDLRDTVREHILLGPVAPDQLVVLEDDQPPLYLTEAQLRSPAPLLVAAD
jgi:hypothetical protein